MILDFLLFPLFTALLCLLGMGVVRLLSALRVTSHSDIPPYLLLFYALFFLGMLTLGLNFFMGIASWLYVALLAPVALLGVRHARSIARMDWLWLGAFSLLLAPLAAGMLMGPDGPLYHLPHQLWLREEKIVLGLTNFHSRFGFASVVEYILAPLWIGENQFKLLTYAMASFGVMFLLFLQQLGMREGKPMAAVVALLTITLLLHSGYIDFHYTSTDVPTGLAFMMTVLLGVSFALRVEPAERGALFAFFMLGLFTAMAKTSGVLVSVWMGYITLLLLWQKRCGWRDVLGAAWLPALLLALWVGRGVLLSGCLLYPSQITCLNLPWAADYLAWENTEGIRSFAQHPGGPPYNLSENWRWLFERWIPYYQGFLLAIGASMLLGALIYRLLFPARLVAGVASRRVVAIPLLLFLAMTLTVWLLNAPHPRFVIGSLALLPVAVLMLLLGLRGLNEQRWDQICRCFAAALQRLTPPRLHTHPLYAWTAEKLHTRPPIKHCIAVLLLLLAAKHSLYPLHVGSLHFHSALFTLPQIEPYIETKPDPNFGVHSEKGYCNLVRYCAADSHPPRTRYGDYYMFERWVREQ